MFQLNWRLLLVVVELRRNRHYHGIFRIHSFQCFAERRILNNFVSNLRMLGRNNHELRIIDDIFVTAFPTDPFFSVLSKIHFSPASSFPKLPPFLHYSLPIFGGDLGDFSYQICLPMVLSRFRMKHKILTTINDTSNLFHY